MARKRKLEMIEDLDGIQEERSPVSKEAVPPRPPQVASPAPSTTMLPPTLWFPATS